MSRSIERLVARKLYSNFTKQWRNEMRSKGLYGQKTNFKRPTFNQWFVMHEKDLDMMKQSSPSDVQEYQQMSFEDPWADKGESESVSTEERGSVTMNISGDNG